MVHCSSDGRGKTGQVFCPVNCVWMDPVTHRGIGTRVKFRQRRRLEPEGIRGALSADARPGGAIMEAAIFSRWCCGRRVTISRVKPVNHVRNCGRCWEYRLLVNSWKFFFENAFHKTTKRETANAFSPVSFAHLLYYTNTKKHINAAYLNFIDKAQNDTRSNPNKSL